MASSYANGGTSRMLIAEMINNNKRKNKSTFVGSFESEGWV